ncbi:uncharacterized protein JCM15063_003573 [Sporobolomyces koalae]|uniref:uncharacterized protein n=1 Tax=Sporobolomyces koalae TaxID=500713 RepID=UPI00316B3514
MLVELISWGHPGRLAPKPTPAKTLIKKREKESKSRFILHFDQQFSDWSLWDNTKLVIGCIFIGTAWWGLYLVIMLHKTAGEFVIEVPTSHTPAALALGSLGTALFTIARFPELYEGWIRDRKKEKPTLSLSDGTFVFLIIENLFNLLSIFVLSMGPQLEGKGKLKTYIFGELPWILGGIIPIIFDAVLVDRIIVWQKNWKKHSYANEPEKKDELDHLAIDIERAKAALAHFQELSENVEVESTAIEHHAQMQRRNEKRSRGGWTNRVRDSVGRPKEKTSPLQKDYHENLTGLLRETANGRAHKALATTSHPAADVELHIRSSRALRVARRSIVGRDDQLTCPRASDLRLVLTGVLTHLRDQQGPGGMAPPTHSRLPRVAACSSILRDLDPATLPFLRAAALGYTAQTAPAIVRALTKRKGKSAVQVLVQLLKAFKFKPRGLALAFGIAVGGAKYGERLLEPVVRRVYLASREKARSLREGKGKTKEIVLSQAEEVNKLETDHKIIATLTTACSATISSFLAILLLQSSPTYRRPSIPLAVSTDPKLDFSVSPYAVTTTANQVRPTGRMSRHSPTTSIVQSPTLDLTLFVFVRAVDTLVRGTYLYTGATAGRFGPTTTFLASNADTLTFSLSCFIIMSSWFYNPDALPPSYNRWILQLARMDKRLLELLRHARNGTFVYGEKPSDEVLKMCQGIAAYAGKDPSTTNPELISRFSCEIVHGRVGRGTCEVNALKRWARAFLDCLLIYLPVHAIPPLLFNFSKVMRQPGSSIVRILLAASRSSAFLATFVASIYASVCLVRTRLPRLFPRGKFLRQQRLDGGLAVYLGCIMCGFSVLIENKRRRREMALFTATRALYAVVDDVAPNLLTNGPTGEFLTKWLERIIFSTSAGTVIAATVHRPDLVSGVVSGVVGVAVKDW